MGTEADRELSRCAAFWISGGTQNSGNEWKQLLGAKVMREEFEMARRAGVWNMLEWHRMAKLLGNWTSR